MKNENKNYLFQMLLNIIYEWQDLVLQPKDFKEPCMIARANLYEEK